MQIVIDIDDKEYFKIMSEDDGDITSYLTTVHLYDAVRHVKPLPKGHGDLIDRSDLLEYTDISISAYTPTISRYDIITAPTIIEADREE